MRRSIVLSLFVIVTRSWNAVPLAAQNAATSTPAPGARIRVTVDGAPAPIVGSLLAATADSIAYTFPVPGGLANTSDTATVARRSIRRLEVSTGRHRHVRHSVGWGILGAGTAGGVIGAASYSPCTETGFLACFMEPRSRTEAAVWGVALGGILGSGAGLIAGLLHRSEDWRSVPPENVARIRVLPGVHGVSAAVSFSLP
jgi:hypothetical protein